MGRLLGQLVGLTLVYFAFRLIKRHADKQEASRRQSTDGQNNDPKNY
jgi:hypothetical protein